MRTIAVIILAMLCHYAGRSACNNEDSLNKKIETAFKNAFTGAKYIHVEKQKDLVKISFMQEEQKMFAYYSGDGELVALGHNITVQQLPLSASSRLKEKAENKFLTELFEVSQNGETNYYATIDDGEWSTIFIADGAGKWVVFKRSAD